MPVRTERVGQFHLGICAMPGIPAAVWRHGGQFASVFFQKWLNLVARQHAVKRAAVDV
jgi:hypothetical protein